MRKAYLDSETGNPVIECHGERAVGSYDTFAYLESEHNGHERLIVFGPYWEGILPPDMVGQLFYLSHVIGAMGKHDVE